MKKTSITAMVFLTIFMLISTMQPMPVTATNEHGPRHCKGLEVFFYETPDLAYGALKACAVDFIQWGLTAEQVRDACEDPNLQLASYAENGMFEFDVNSNYTIMDEPGKESPTHTLSMRRAIAHMISKPWILSECLKGQGDRIDQPIAAPQTAWCNESTIGDNYWYAFDMEKARILLFGDLVPVCEQKIYAASTYINFEEPSVIHVKEGVVVRCDIEEPIPISVQYPIEKGVTIHCLTDANIHLKEGKARYGFKIRDDWYKAERYGEEIPVCEQIPYPSCTYITTATPSKIHVKEGLVMVTNTMKTVPVCEQMFYNVSTVIHFEEDSVIHLKEGEAMRCDTGEWIPICEPVPIEKCTCIIVMMPSVIHLMEGKATYGFPLTPSIPYNLPTGATLHVCCTGAVIHVEYGRAYTVNRYLAKHKFEGCLFPKGPDCQRYMDRNCNGRKDECEDLVMKLVVRTEDWRLCCGRYLATQLEACQITVNKVEGTSDVTGPIVMTDMNYHVYTGGWGLGRYPTYLYSLYHSKYCYPDGPNYITGFDENGNPNYPDVDAAVEGLYFGKNIDDAMDSCKTFCFLHAQYCINVPLWSVYGYMTYKKNLVGICNMDGYGLENEYTFLNAYKVDDPSTPEDESQEPIRFATVNAPKQLNILYSKWYYDYSVLDRIYEGLRSVQPFALGIDQPWIAQDWEESVWTDPQDGKNKTKATWWLRKDVRWKAPETCEFVTNFTAHDMEFTIWYNYAFDDSWQFSGFEDVHHTKIVNDHCIEIYSQAEAWTMLGSPTYPILGPKEILMPLLCEEKCVTYDVDQNYTECEKFMITDDQIVQVINCTKDIGTPDERELIECDDFQICADYATYCHNLYHTKINLTEGQTITLCYWTPKLAAGGNYLAGLDWTQTMYSIGPYCPTQIVKGVGGWAKLKCNDCFFLETPPLGEIDWRWIWEPGPKPRSGYYKIDIYDVVKATAAYCHRGDSCPEPGVVDPKWNPSADLDATDLCHVGIYDVVTITGKYGRRFGSPPDC